tara:strand:+ start:83 stop:229 length:147 start_codon:yes stop_codon:yes gene_type:complete
MKTSVCGIRVTAAISKIPGKGIITARNKSFTKNIFVHCALKIKAKETN